MENSVEALESHFHETVCWDMWKSQYSHDDNGFKTCEYFAKSYFALLAK